MLEQCTLQLHADGTWHDVGTMTLLGEPREGWRAKTYTGYSVEWAVAHADRRDALALSCRTPVDLRPLELPHWPVFLIDTLPQGFGREELLRRLTLPTTAREEADWALLLTGAGNPIGNLRIKEAAAWLAQHSTGARGFTDEEVALRGEDFAEFLASHGLFVAGSSGVQGEWPKLLLTRARDGLLYLDHTLPDDQAVQHHIVKFGRGTEVDLARILRHEAPYMRAARVLGLNVHAELVFRERALFIPRFDRRIEAEGDKTRVVRLAQESIATLTGMPGFGAVPSHDEVCRQLWQRCTDPQADVLEYIKRDIANIALGNKDNHARNTALQRGFDGRIALTPLYDFVPMYMHPDGIARRIRWEGNDDGAPDWARVVDAVCEPLPEAPSAKRPKRTPRGAVRPQMDRATLVSGLRDMAPALRHVLAEGAALGIEPEVMQHLATGIETQARQLEQLR